MLVGRSIFAAQTPHGSRKRARRARNEKIGALANSNLVDCRWN